jgi:hypothetical protein
MSAIGTERTGAASSFAKAAEGASPLPGEAINPKKTTTRSNKRKENIMGTTKSLFTACMCNPGRAQSGITTSS